MIARTTVARPSLGEAGRVWVEITPSSTGESLGAFLNPEDALRLASDLIVAVRRIRGVDE
jgi:uncharacterized membrane protein